MRTACSASAVFLLISLATVPPGPAQSAHQLGHAAAPSGIHGETTAAPAGNTTPTQPDAVQDAAQDIGALHRLEANYLRAEMENSATLAQSILADDYLGVKGDGGTASKQDVLNSLSTHSQGREPYNITATNMREHVFGDTACVTYTKLYTLPSTGAVYSENLLHVFTKRNGIWHLQVSAPVPAPHSQVPPKQ